MPEDTEPQWRIVYRARTQAPCREHALVLEAVGIDYDEVAAQRDIALAVRPEDAARATEQLRLYERENRLAPRPAPRAMASDGMLGALLYVAVLLLFHDLQHFRLLAETIAAAGGAEAGAIRQGEWWRAVTALTLHADLAHLLGNMGFGALFGVFASQILGSGLAWFSILLAAILGNLLNAFIQPPTHSSIGASTAVFSAVGIICAHAWHHRAGSQRPGLRRLAPLFVGVAVLALIGGPGERVDVMAHLTGFAAGVLAGVACSVLARRIALRRGHQALLGAAALCLVILGWWLALTRA